MPAAGLDRGADGEFSKRSSSHFELWQDVAIDQTGGFHGSRRVEQQVLEELERAYERLDDHLGLRPSRRIRVLVYDAGVFERQFAGRFRFGVAGFYNGVIYIRGTTSLTPYLKKVLHHELVHAALDEAAPSLVYPAWLNEGLAEWFEWRAFGKRHLSGREWAKLVHARRNGGLLSLASLSAPSLGGLGPGVASLAYLQSYGLIDYLSRSYGERSLRDLCSAVVRTRNLERALQRVYRLDAAELEAAFAAELG